MISLRGLSKQYREPGGRSVPVLTSASLEVAAGEFVAVMGPSGSGKSTLLHVLGGLDAHFTGDAEVGGVKLAGLNDTALSRFRAETVGFVFQSFHLVAEMSAVDNIRLPSFFRAGAPLSEAEARKRALTLLTRVGLKEKGNRTPAQLSGGERQRVAIARALFFKPPLLLCDEPTGNLDSATGAEVIELFKDLHREGLTLLTVTHEERMSAAASRVVRLRDGKLEAA